MQAIDITASVADQYQIDPALFIAFKECEGIDLEEAADRFGDQFSGIWSDLEAWAEEMLAGTGELDAMPERLRFYFNFEAYARDCVLSGDVWTIDMPEGIAVFWSR